MGAEDPSEGIDFLCFFLSAGEEPILMHFISQRCYNKFYRWSGRSRLQDGGGEVP